HRARHGRRPDRRRPAPGRLLAQCREGLRAGEIGLEAGCPGRVSIATNRGDCLGWRLPDPGQRGPGHVPHPRGGLASTIAALGDETGIDNGYRVCGGVDVAQSEAEAQGLAALAGRWREEGIAFERLAPGDYVRVEPALSADLGTVYFLPDRAQIRNPWHLRAL